MNLRFKRHFYAFATLLLTGPWVSAQVFQQLHAHDTGANARAGEYADVSCLDAAGPNNESIVSVGSFAIGDRDGVITYATGTGVPVRMSEVSDPDDGVVEGRTICETPSGDIVACFYDPLTNSTNVIRTQNTGILIWKRKLPGFQVQDVVCGSNAGAPGGELIWMTGMSMQNRLIALEALDGTGGWVFGKEYFLNGSFRETTGTELIYDSVANRITMVGIADVDTCIRKDLIVVRTTPSGNFIWGRTFYDRLQIENNGFDHFYGRAIRKHPDEDAIVIAFEYKDPTLAPQRQWPGLMELTPGGALNWMYSYQDGGAGFFRGLDFRVNGLDATKDSYLLSGGFNSITTPGAQKSAYSLEVSPTGTGLTFNEYETSSFYASRAATLGDLEWHPLQEKYCIVGGFRTTPNPVGWPQGPTPQSFWMIGTDVPGTSGCSNNDLPVTVGYLPDVVNLQAQVLDLPSAQASPLVVSSIPFLNKDQCTAAKTNEAGRVLLENAFEVSYQSSTGMLEVEVPEGNSANGSLELLNLQGQVLLQAEAIAGTQRLSTSSLSRGVYLLRHISGKNTLHVQKVMLY